MVLSHTLWYLCTQKCIRGRMCMRGTTVCLLSMAAVICYVYVGSRLDGLACMVYYVTCYLILIVKSGYMIVYDLNTKFTI